MDVQSDINEPIRELLKRCYIGPQRAERLARGDLRLWPVPPVKAIFDQIAFVKDKDYNPCGRDVNIYGMSLYARVLIWATLGVGVGIVGPVCTCIYVISIHRTGSLAALKRRWGKIFDLCRMAWEMGVFVKAPTSMVEEANAAGAALCVNVTGKFCIKRSGYVVVSHSWYESMGWDGPGGVVEVDLGLRKRGIQKRHLCRFFDRCDAEWLWLDFIAMPEVLEDMSESERTETERLRVGVLNNLHAIYTQADHLVVLDNLTIQLQTGSLIDVGVVLCAGRWIQSTWTLTESCLAKEVKIATAGGMKSLDDVIEALDVPTLSDSHRYYVLWLRLSTCRVPLDQENTRVDRFFTAWKSRCAFDPADRIKALYPFLRMTWGVGWSTEQGIEHLTRHTQLHLPESSPGVSR